MLRSPRPGNAVQPAPTSTAHAGDGRTEGPVVAARTGADRLLETLGLLGVDTVFGYPGGAVLPLYDALARQNRIRHVLVRHEQAAVHAAQGYARATGKVGVVFATSGPGATNLVTGLADALADSTPILCITGQVARHLLGSDAFQEANIVSVLRPVTKYNALITDPSTLQNRLVEAFNLARSGRPGPVALDIPKDVQAGLTAKGRVRLPAGRRDRRAVADLKAKATEAAQLLLAAERPALYVGGGAIQGGERALDAVWRIAKATGAPVTGTLMALGAYPASDPQWLGMLGMHGTYEANLTLHGCDVMLCAGGRFDDRVTGRVDAFAPRSTRIHLDIDPASLDKIVACDVTLPCDAAVGLPLIADALEEALAGGAQQPDRAPWWGQIRQWQTADCLAYPERSGALVPQQVLMRLWQKTAKLDPIVTTDVGQHQMWSAQYLRFDRPRRWITSGGLGTMGFGLPAAIGAQLACPDRLTLCISGDASVQMNIQELATAAQHEAPVKLLILNNGYMGMVRQWQDLHHEGRRSSSYTAAMPDFANLARAYHLSGFRVDHPDRLDDMMDRWLAAPGAAVLDCRVAAEENCYPMMPAGAAHNQILLRPEDD